MSEIKYFQIRDVGTNIPAMAIRLDPSGWASCRIVNRAGYGNEGDYIILVSLEGCETHYSPFEWGINPRTMHIAHQEIIDNWEKYASGAVICVESVLGEIDKPKSFE